MTTDYDNPLYKAISWPDQKKKKYEGIDSSIKRNLATKLNMIDLIFSSLWNPYPNLTNLSSDTKISKEKGKK